MRIKRRSSAYIHPLPDAAQGCTKPTKADAQLILLALHDRHPESVQDLAKLYVYFTPQRVSARRIKTEFDWVALAAGGPKDVREYLRYVYVTEETITATDGHRLHQVPNKQKLSPGYYDPANGLLRHKPDWQHYPDVRRVIPDRSSPARITMPFRRDKCELRPFFYKKTSGHMYVVTLPRNKGTVAFNAKYVDEALIDQDEVDGSFAGPDSQFGVNGSVRFDYHDRLVVVMPMKD